MYYVVTELNGERFVLIVSPLSEIAKSVKKLFEKSHPTALFEIEYDNEPSQYEEFSRAYKYYVAGNDARKLLGQCFDLTRP